MSLFSGATEITAIVNFKIQISVIFCFARGDGPISRLLPFNFVWCPLLSSSLGIQLQLTEWLPIIVIEILRTAANKGAS
jgi:hypothetical protein